MKDINALLLVANFKLTIGGYLYIFKITGGVSDSGYILGFLLITQTVNSLRPERHRCLLVNAVVSLGYDSDLCNTLTVAEKSLLQ